MEKIKVIICTGTTCFVMGSSKLQNFDEFIPKKWKEFLDIKTHPCLNLCQNNEYTKSPYVMINDEVLTQVTIEKLIDAIENKLMAVIKL